MTLFVSTGPARADVPLTRADIEAILNRVELITRGRAARPARLRDFMGVGDTLRTAAQSRAELRFNDGSLARVGERATFRFVPNTRNFRLSNGTMLLLVPPGRGRTTIQTPSAITGIQGSGVVVRHIEDRDLTVVMALTNNPAGPMTVTSSGCGSSETLAARASETPSSSTKNNKDQGEKTAAGSENSDEADCTTEYPLYAGQMALVQGRQVQILDFDLPTFYQTSPLIDGLNLDNDDPDISLGPALDQVRAETLEALQQESFFSDTTVLNPEIIGVGTPGQAVADAPLLLSPMAGEVSPLRRTGVLAPPPGVLAEVTNQPELETAINNSSVTTDSTITPPTTADVAPNVPASPPEPAATPVAAPTPTVTTPTVIAPTPAPTPPVVITPVPTPVAPTTPIVTAPTPTPVAPTPVTPTPAPT
ncbi:MAG TPA: FecR domain-containing protein, partial [Leptolyngbyaceae cyanobacterium M65_K2018_010]|nr:FecR domain-containing protein [Leptolyngbyaceae cyanobacterium M65_K2018_010]